MLNVLRVVNRPSVLVYEEFFGRQSRDTRPLLLLLPTNRDVKDRSAHRIDALLNLYRLNALFVQEGNKSLFRETRELVGGNNPRLVPPPLDDAGLTNKRILERGVANTETIIVLLDDVVDVIRSLFGSLNVFRASGHELHCLRPTRRTPA